MLSFSGLPIPALPTPGHPCVETEPWEDSTGGGSGTAVSPAQLQAQGRYPVSGVRKGGVGDGVGGWGGQSPEVMPSLHGTLP